MSSPNSERSIPAAVQTLGLCALGAVELLLIYCAMQLSSNGSLPSSASAAIVVFVLVTAATIHFGWTGRNLLRLALIALAMSFGLAVVTYAVFVQIPPMSGHAPFQGDSTRAGYWGVLLFVFVYVAGPFIQTYQKSGRLEFPYRDLFVFSWANFHIGCLGVLFVAAVYVVLALWAALFHLIGVEFFATLFQNGFFLWSVSGAALAYGIDFALRRTDLILTLRGVTLGVLKLLLPPVALIALAFVATVPFHGLAMLSATDQASTILLFWSVLMIVLLNAVYQDGSEGRPFGRLVVVLIETAFVALPLFAAFAIYGLSLRIGQYGLTVFRTYGIVTASIIALYCIGYAGAVLHRKAAWLADVRPINRWMAWLVLAVVIALQTPWLDPYRLSADSQVRRVVEGRVVASEFDFGYLKFRLGHVGAEALDELRDYAVQNRKPDLTAALNEVAQSEDLYVLELARTGKPFTVTSVGPMPAGLTEALQHTDMQQRCRMSPCVAFPIMEAPDAAPSYGVVEASGYPIPFPVFVARKDGSWYPLGRFVTDGGISAERGASLDAGDYAVVPPLFPDLRIGTVRFHFREAAPVVPGGPSSDPDGPAE